MGLTLGHTSARKVANLKGAKLPDYRNVRIGISAKFPGFRVSLYSTVFPSANR